MLTTHRIHKSSIVQGTPEVEDLTEQKISHTGEFIKFLKMKGPFDYLATIDQSSLVNKFFFGLALLIFGILTFAGLEIPESSTVGILFTGILISSILYIIYIGMKYLRLESQQNTIKKKFYELIGKLKGTQTGERHIEIYLDKFRLTIDQDRGNPGINPTTVDSIRKQIQELNYNIKALQNNYKEIESELLQNTGVFWNENEFNILRKKYKRKNQEHMLSLNIQLKKLLESWLDIHATELKELDNQLRSETKTIKDNSGKLALEQQIMRLEQYISSIQSIPKY